MESHKSAPLMARALWVLEGTLAACFQRARTLLAACPEVLWIGPGHCPPGRVVHYLGQSFDAVVLALHTGLEARVLGQVQGLIRGGGVLVLCLPPPDAPLPGKGFWQRFLRALSTAPVTREPQALQPPPRPQLGSPEQALCVQRLHASFAQPKPARVTLLAARGRGKSSTLGLSLNTFSELPAQALAITGPRPEALVELLAFANRGRDQPNFAYASPEEVFARTPSPRVLVVDEAAQLPVALLKALVLKHSSAHLVLSTTTYGYEGTGRGFSLRFLPWLAAHCRQTDALTTLQLTNPIRWAPDDPLEHFVARVLLLDQEPPSGTLPTGVPRALAPRREHPQVCKLDLARLRTDESLLQKVFSLLVQAHYRTSPDTLQHLLDSDTLQLYVVMEGAELVAACMLDREAALSRAECRAMATGQYRIHGHALADSLVVHAGRPDAGELSMLRSVRLATQYERRKQGLAGQLVECIHRHESPELFGTIFGATPDLLRFRRAHGYAFVRLSSGRNHASGEPSVLMVRPCSTRAQALVADLRLQLARDLPFQLRCLMADDPLGLEPELLAALYQDLPSAPQRSDAEVRRAVQHYVHSVQPFDAASHAVCTWLERWPEDLRLLAPKEQRLLHGRLVETKSWRSLQAELGFASVHALLRSLRPIVAKLCREACGPETLVG